MLVPSWCSMHALREHQAQLGWPTGVHIRKHIEKGQATGGCAVHRVLDLSWCAVELVTGRGPDRRTAAQVFTPDHKLEVSTEAEVVVVGPRMKLHYCTASMNSA